MPERTACAPLRMLKVDKGNAVLFRALTVVLAQSLLSDLLRVKAAYVVGVDDCLIADCIALLGGHVVEVVVMFLGCFPLCHFCF